MKMNGLMASGFDQWFQASRQTGATHRIFVTASGYETRSTHWCRQYFERSGPLDNVKWVVLGFADQKDIPARKKNDDFYGSKQLSIKEFQSGDGFKVTDWIRSLFQKSLDDTGNLCFEIHVDYSSMPRVWYCSLFTELEKLIRPQDRLYFWYSAGNYQEGLYPTAGMSDFSVFSGKTSLTPLVRTHFFGLGFDRIRASAIHRVLDPQNLICFYADPACRQDFVKRVKSDNRDVIAAARFVFTVPINDFAISFSRLTALARESARSGDVIFVPDGPKPLVLASSLVPAYLDQRGIISLHVRRQKTESPPATDICPLGEIYGFVVSG